ncbi:D-alanine--poly(phosphoribitol) ligase subunit 1 [Ruegeria sp. P4]|nr:D-alanine--poly(phosphoribitol) ligase subunit 1 [Ruegeria sp. P4]
MTERFLRDIAIHIWQHPDRPALVSDGHITSFGALGAQVQAVLTWLRAHPSSDLVMVHGHKEPGVVAAMLACMFAGRGFVFADRSNPPDRIARMLRVSGAQLLLHAGHAPDVDAAVHSHPIPAGAAQSLAQDAVRDVDPKTLLYVIFTSGSTGDPKGVPIRRDNFSAFFAWYGEMLQAIAGQTLAAWQSGHVNHASLAFDMGMLDLWPVLALGRPVVMLNHRYNIMPRKNMDALSGQRDRVAVRSWFSTPSLLQLMCTDPTFSAETLPELRCFFVGGEAVQPSLIKELRRRFPKAEVRHAYGPSEGTCMSHVHCLTEGDLKRHEVLPLGPALAQNVMRIIDNDGHDVPRGTPGEVELSGPQIVSGYIPADHPANRAFSMRDGAQCYRTGDLGYVDAAGHLFLLGRADRQVKWNGNRIELDEIERAAHGLDLVHNAACLPVREDGQLRDIVLFVQPASGAHLSATSCAQALAARLPQTMIPRDIRLMERLPVTVNGKVDSQALLAQLNAPIPEHT